MIIFLLLFFTLSCSTEVVKKINDAIYHLQTEVNQLKVEEQLRSIVKQIASDINKSDEGSIEEDVQKNDELRMDVIQHDFKSNEINKDEDLDNRVRESNCRQTDL